MSLREKKKPFTINGLSLTLKTLIIVYYNLTETHSFIAIDKTKPLICTLQQYLHFHMLYKLIKVTT